MVGRNPAERAGETLGLNPRPVEDNAARLLRRITMNWDANLPMVAGRRMLKSHAQFERQCQLLLKAEQEKISPDCNLIDALCEAVRLSREHCDYATKNLHATV